jgi:RNA polymerase sigma-70 factor (ECF subfamily)
VQEPDPATIRAAAAGDLAAFEDLVRAYQQHIWRFLRRLVGDATVAEDVAQETFLRAFRRLPTFTFQSKFSTWLFQIARNAGIDELRARERRARILQALPPPAVPGAGPAEARVEIDAALASLPVGLRETIVLVEVFGLRYVEAAEVLGVAVGTVKSRMFAARQHIQRWGRSAAGDGTQGVAGDL